MIPRTIETFLVISCVGILVCVGAYLTTNDFFYLPIIFAFSGMFLFSIGYGVGRYGR